MKITRRDTLVQLAMGSISAATLMAAPSARAQGFPDRPIRLVVPYAAGGLADSLARTLGESLRKTLGQTVVIDNKPGANSAIGAQMVAKAPADGYTLLLCTGATLVTGPLLYKKLTYNPDDLTPVARVAVSPLVLEVHPGVPAATLAELIRYGRANPGKLNYATTGIGSVVQLASLLFEQQAGLQMTHIPFNGSSQAFTAILGGEVQMFMDAVGSSVPLIKDGRLRALAVSSPERLKALPDVPTIAESGFPGFDASAWYGIVAPAQTPPQIVARLNEAIGAATAGKAFREQFEAIGVLVPPPASVASFVEHIRQDRDKWGPLIKAKNLTLD